MVKTDLELWKYKWKHECFVNISKSESIELDYPWLQEWKIVSQSWFRIMKGVNVVLQMVSGNNSKSSILVCCTRNI